MPCVKKRSWPCPVARKWQGVEVPDSSLSSSLTAGSWLRQQREAANVSLDALCVALKVQPSRLLALESDDWDSLPDTLFIRSLALGICRHLRADERVLLPLLPAPPQRDLRVGHSDVHSIPYNPKRWSGPMLFFSDRGARAIQHLLAGLFLLLVMGYLGWHFFSDTSEPVPVSAVPLAQEREKASPSVTPPPQETQSSPVQAHVDSQGQQNPQEVSAQAPNPVLLGAKPHVVITPVIPLALKQNSDNPAPLTTKP